LLAHLAPAADAAVLYRLGICRRRRRAGDKLEARLGVAEVGTKVGDAERLSRAVAEHQVHTLGLAALHASQQLGVERRLEQRRGLGAACELGVDGLVAERADALEEVRVAEPAAIEERGLVDNVGARAHGLERLL